MEVDEPSTTEATNIVLDYSNLSSDLKHTSRMDREMKENELRIKIDEASLELARLEPNMKALEQYETIKEKERLQAVELEAAKDRVKQATDAFEDVRNRRRAIFLDAFQHIADSIDHDETECPILSGTLVSALVHASVCRCYGHQPWTSHRQTLWAPESDTVFMNPLQQVCGPGTCHDRWNVGFATRLDKHAEALAPRNWMYGGHHGWSE